MPALTQQRRDTPLPHSCPHCNDFVIYLFDDLGEVRTEKPIWRSPNPSQDRLAASLYGNDFWAAEWEQYREEFYRATDGISFFDTTRDGLEHSAREGCLLASRFVSCLREDELPERYAIGAHIITSYSLELGIFDLESLRWEMLLGGDEDEEPDNVYTITALKGSPAAQVVDNHPVNLDPGADSTLSTAKHWLQDCMQNHKTCTRPKSTFTPTRLIEIASPGDAVACRLREMSSASVEPYAALSYCWGGDQTFKTTLQTLPLYLKGIDPRQLPQTLQDAIFVAHQLELGFIWIDALCIIQDSPSDKAVEIGQMAEVYANATVTIGATRAQAVRHGFLSKRSALGQHLPSRVFSLPCHGAGEDMGTLTLVPFTHEGVEPLDTRGWTFQERVLSPRVLDFGTLRTQYTCQTMLGQTPSDGWSSYPIERAYGHGLNAQIMSDLIAGLYPAERMLKFWLKVVEGFTSRGLTFAGDKLPAIAGMAECFGVLINDEYCAGLWRKGMPSSLLWTTGNRIQHIDGELQPRLPVNQTAAPSWSWAAVSPAVDYSYILLDETAQFQVDIIDCAIELADDRATYGAVKRGTLTFKAFARPTKWARGNIYRKGNVLIDVDNGISHDLKESELGFRPGGASSITFIPDALEKEFQDDPKSTLDVLLLLFGTTQPNEETGMFSSFFGVVVRPARNEEGRFSRVGIFQKTLGWRDFERYMEWFKKDTKQVFVIV